VRLGIQTSRLPGESLDEQFDAASRCGFDAVEVNIGPAFDLSERFGDLRQASERSGLPICAICTHSIHDPLVPDGAERSRRFSGLTELIRTADELGAAGVVSVPVRPPHVFPDGTNLEQLAVEEFREWAHALPPGDAAVFLEPLNRYEAYFLRRVEQAVDISRQVDHPRVSALADLFHMNIEEADMAEPIRSAGSQLGHVHIADNNRAQPGAGCLDFLRPFAALKAIDYRGYITIECSTLGGPLLSQGPLAMLSECVRFLRDRWDRA
jgi:sugar phosphate isomerase/epimerase